MKLVAARTLNQDYNSLLKKQKHYAIFGTEREMKASQGKGRKGLGMDKFADWEVGKDYECVKVLGQGSYGAVASAVHKPSGKKVAIKKMAGVFEDDVDCKRILREIYLLK